MIRRCFFPPSRGGEWAGRGYGDSVRPSFWTERRIAQHLVFANLTSPTLPVPLTIRFFLCPICGV